MQALKGGEENVEKRTEWGQTVVHEDVLGAIAIRAALMVPGVAQMSQHGIGDNLNTIVRHDASSRGVRVVETETGHYSVELYLHVYYGVRLAELGRQVGQGVNEALKDAIGQYPRDITIHIEGVREVVE